MHCDATKNKPPFFKRSNLSVFQFSLTATAYEIENYVQLLDFHKFSPEMEIISHRQYGVRNMLHWEKGSITNSRSAICCSNFKKYTHITKIQKYYKLCTVT